MGVPAEQPVLMFPRHSLLIAYPKVASLRFLIYNFLSNFTKRNKKEGTKSDTLWIKAMHFFKTGRPQKSSVIIDGKFDIPTVRWYVKKKVLRRFELPNLEK